MESYFQDGLLSKAEKSGLLEKQMIPLRDFSKNKYKSVDGKAYGGGDGMVMSVEPVSEAIASARAQAAKNHRVILLTPQGRTFSQGVAKELVKFDELIFVCGRYAGFDHRISDFCDEEISIGDYVLSGGELAALVVTEATMRLVPGFLGNEQSSIQDSFSEGQNQTLRLEAPQFTEPVEFKNKKVPAVLTSGHHQKIREWKMGMSLIMTLIKRPDLIQTPISKIEFDAAFNVLNETDDSNLFGQDLQQIKEKIRGLYK